MFRPKEQANSCVVTGARSFADSEVARRVREQADADVRVCSVDVDTGLKFDFIRANEQPVSHKGNVDFMAIRSASPGLVVHRRKL